MAKKNQWVTIHLMAGLLKGKGIKELQKLQKLKKKQSILLEKLQKIKNLNYIYKIAKAK
jgi:hypothetical protein